MSDETNGQQDLESAADGLRRLTDLLVRVTGDDGRSAAVADELDKIAVLLEEHCDDGAANDRDPVSGTRNAFAPPFDVDIDDDGNVSATGLLGLPYQGPKSLVHGGMSALVLSHVLGAAGSVEGEPGVVSELSVRYHRPTPLFTELQVSAAAIDPEHGRAQGSITADGVVTVSAEARVAPPPLQ
jgi:hypothetical protein